MKYVNQLEYAHIPYPTRTSMEGEEFERGRKTTVRSSGCGLCSAVMVADRLLVNYDFDLDAAASLSLEVAANHKPGTDYKRFAPAFAERMGFRWECSDDLEDLRQCLRTNGAAVVHIGGDREGHIGVFSHGGHYIVAVGLEDDGRFVILDPSYKEGKYEEEGRKGLVEVKNGVIALCHGEVLEADTTDKDPKFWLFWRR